MNDILLSDIRKGLFYVCPNTRVTTTIIKVEKHPFGVFIHTEKCGFKFFAINSKNIPVKQLLD